MTTERKIIRAKVGLLKVDPTDREKPDRVSGIPIPTN